MATPLSFWEGRAYQSYKLPQISVDYSSLIWTQVLGGSSLANYNSISSSPAILPNPWARTIDRIRSWYVGGSEFRAYIPKEIIMNWKVIVTCKVMFSYLFFLLSRFPYFFPFSLNSWAHKNPCETFRVKNEFSEPRKDKKGIVGRGYEVEGS